MILILCFHEQNYVKCRLGVTFTSTDLLKRQTGNIFNTNQSWWQKYQLYSDCTFNIVYHC